MQNKMKTVIEEFFKKLNIDIDSIELNKSDTDNNFKIKIKTEESGILIGPQGKNLDAIQNIIKIILSKLTWKKIKLQLEINDYSKTKDDRLSDFINKEISYLEKNWKDIKLPFYSSYERKKIHSLVHKMKSDTIFTKSIWEWRERRLYLCKKTPKLTIDIDWDDI